MTWSYNIYVSLLDYILLFVYEVSPNAVCVCLCMALLSDYHQPIINLFKASRSSLCLFSNFIVFFRFFLGLSIVVWCTQIEYIRAMQMESSGLSYPLVLNIVIHNSQNQTNFWAIVWHSTDVVIFFFIFLCCSFFLFIPLYLLPYRIISISLYLSLSHTYYSLSYNVALWNRAHIACSMSTVLYSKYHTEKTSNPTQHAQESLTNVRISSRWIWFDEALKWLVNIICFICAITINHQRLSDLYNEDHFRVFVLPSASFEKRYSGWALSHYIWMLFGNILFYFSFVLLL